MNYVLTRPRPTGGLNLASGSLIGLAAFGVAVYVAYRMLDKAVRS